MRVRNVPIWALLFFVPVTLLAINNASVDVQDDANVVLKNDVAAQDMQLNTDTMNAPSNDLNLQDGATNDWHGRWGGWGRGWGGWGRWGGWGGWGGWGSYWPWNWGWSSWWPYSSWYY